jgi:hypothetical protein
MYWSHHKAVHWYWMNEWINLWLRKRSSCLHRRRVGGTWRGRFFTGTSRERWDLFHPDPVYWGNRVICKRRHWKWASLPIVSPLGNLEGVRFPGTLRDSNIWAPLSWTKMTLRVRKFGAIWKVISGTGLWCFSISVWGTYGLSEGLGALEPKGLEPTCYSNLTSQREPKIYHKHTGCSTVGLGEEMGNTQGVVQSVWVRRWETHRV